MAENTVTLTVQGVESEDDVQRIRDELEDVEGVMGVEREEQNQLAVRYDVDLLAEERVKITVREMGYEVE